MTSDTNTHSPSESRQRGLARMSEVYGWEFADGPGEHFALTADHLFGDIWSRAVLTDRDRRLLLLGALTATGLFDVAEIQVGAALRNNELTEEQLREIAIFLCHYVGWPAGTKLDSAIGTVLSQERRKKS
ncbi:carboxymuconolactone decarboxylase family protein [Nocardia sp. NBC_00565]|uniref:carboxymuconolactone decarboxylase family protein n=1 Tax=Nocardia sp. NBC_00565 TaxID=2975993 RepID=UPI002E80843A|nr:carboxymuconolactone decarboxylase family protein [Nocardia sp. NBC_00565]WUC04681.1 carboxymuconolactone decarboxylase family protein [Nocardia sp. NBC_00565]